VLVGTVAKRIAAKESEASAYRLMRNSYFVMTGFGVLLMVGAFVLAKPLVPVILGPSFGPTVEMLYLLALMFPFAAFGQVTSGYVLVPLRKDKLMSGLSLFGALVTVSLMLLLAQTYFGQGIAAARSVGSVVTCVALVWVLHQQQLLKRIWNA
jgi:O-antigen/teichoic acid export membrane protein